MTRAFSPEELAAVRASHFNLASQREQVYLANHSLGRPLDGLAASLAEFAATWHRDMDSAWQEWVARTEEFCNLVSGLLGVADPTNIVPKTSAGQGLRAVLNSFPVGAKPNVVTTACEFDSVDFILRTYARDGAISLTLVPPDRSGPVPMVREADIVAAIQPETDLVVVSQCLFATGQVLDLSEIYARAKEVGAICLVDTYHAFACMAVQPGWDFAIGGSYKYVRGGPGACWLALSPEVSASDRQTRDTGWYAKLGTFDYERPIEPLRSPGGRGWWESTPPVVTIYQALPGLRLVAELEVPRIRQDLLLLQQGMRDTFADVGVSLFQPDDPTQFGSFSLFVSDQAQSVVDGLKSHGVTVDARGDSVRFGPDIMTTEDELYRAAVALKSVAG